VNMLSSLLVLVVHSEIGNLLASVEQNKLFSYYDYYDRIRCVKWTSPLTHTFLQVVCFFVAFGKRNRHE
jgi:hypothetical protein